MGDIGRLKTYWQDSAPVRGNAANHSPESVAMVLRNTRILQGYSIGEVANHINIREGHLEAIEEGRFSDLPPLVYAKGFVAAYARFLDFDSSDIVTRFCSEVGYAKALPTTPPVIDLRPVVEDMAERKMPSAALLVVAFVLVGLAYGLWQVIAPDNRAVALEVPPLPDRFIEAQAAVTPMASAPVLETPVVAAPSPVALQDAMITLRALSESWVQLRTPAGERVSSLVLRAGDVYTLPRNSVGLVLSTGSLSSLSILVDGQAVQMAGVTAKNQYQLLLDPARLQNGTALIN